MIALVLVHRRLVGRSRRAPLGKDPRQRGHRRSAGHAGDAGVSRRHRSPARWSASSSSGSSTSIKPYPAGRLEHLHGGPGIMLDDAMAGVYANLALRALIVALSGRPVMTRRPWRRAAILAVGSELLTPSRVDTNSLFITNALNAIGIDVVFKAVVGDDRARARGGLHADAAPRRSRGVDRRARTDRRRRDARGRGRAARAVRSTEDVEITERIRRRFEARGWRMPEINRRQAMVPRGAVVLANPNGTAPGLWIEHGRQGRAARARSSARDEADGGADGRRAAASARRRRRRAPARAEDRRPQRIARRGD